ncbi:MAG: hypothetical protein ACLFVJ_04500 [Persicimonas sp.]
MSEEGTPEDPQPREDDAQEAAQQDSQESLRGTLELPRVVLGGDEADRRAPERRVLPGLVDLRWLSYPAYIACFGAGGIAVNFAIDVPEWSAPPVALAWAMLFFWEWIYGVAYHYRRRVLRYFSFLLVAAMSAGLAALCWERAEPQLVATGAGLAERGHVDSLDWAAILTLVSGVLITLHVVVLGRGYREIKQTGES